MTARPVKKHEQYRELVEARRQCRACSALHNVAELANGALDSDRIGPYSLWQGNLDSPVVVVAQDFSDESGFTRCQGWPGEGIQTNLTLVKLFRAAGIHILPPKHGRSDDRVFLTNAVLCIKRGGMQVSVPQSYFKECGRRFLRPTIELVAPRAVVTLGAGALSAVLTAFGLPSVGKLIPLVESGETFDLACGSRLFPFCHPSPSVINTTRGLASQMADWERLGAWLGAA